MLQMIRERLWRRTQHVGEQEIGFVTSQSMQRAQTVNRVKRIATVHGHNEAYDARLHVFVEAAHTLEAQLMPLDVSVDDLLDRTVALRSTTVLVLSDVSNLDEVCVCVWSNASFTIVATNAVVCATNSHR